MSGQVRFALFISEETDTEMIKSILDVLKTIFETKKVPFDVCDVSEWDDSQKENLLLRIRDISARKKIAVKSQGSGVLPISRKGLLNLRNIPILLVYEDDKPVWAFPSHESESEV